MIVRGDCLEVMSGMEAELVHSIVCDPPYGLSFMGKEWDHGVPGVPFWTAALRVAKPGAYLLAFGGTRTWHRLTVAIEDAGWEIRDTLCWLYGSGFPKSLDVSKAIDKAAGAERERVVNPRWSDKYPNGPGGCKTGGDHAATVRQLKNITGNPLDMTLPATDAARQWSGWGTALKPAFEPVIMARKPVVGTVAGNVLQYGTGGINVDGCRIDTGESTIRHNTASMGYGGSNRPFTGGRGRSTGTSTGRWPANVILDEEAGAMLDEQAGDHPVPGPYIQKTKSRGRIGKLSNVEGMVTPHYGDSGGPSRFFYCAKASRSEREAGLDSTYTVKYSVPKGGTLCEEMVQLLQKVTSDIPTVKWLIGESGESIVGLSPSDSLSTTLTAIRQITQSRTLPSSMHSRTNGSTAGASCGEGNGGSRAESAGNSDKSLPITTNASQAGSALGANPAVLRMLSAISDGANWKPFTNSHSTVKPLSLMRWLVRLVTPPGGTVLDPFAGSGTTGCAAALEGFEFIGIEMDEEYLRIAEAREREWSAQRVLPLMGVSGA